MHDMSICVMNQWLKQSLFHQNSAISTMVNNRLIRHLLIQCPKGQASSWHKVKHLLHQWKVIFKPVNHLQQKRSAPSFAKGCSSQGGKRDPFLFLLSGLTNCPWVGEPSTCSRLRWTGNFRLTYKILIYWKEKSGELSVNSKFWSFLTVTRGQDLTKWQNRQVWQQQYLIFLAWTLHPRDAQFF